MRPFIYSFFAFLFFSISVVSQQDYSKDILLADSLFRKAEKFRDLADYDSAKVYYRQAEHIYIREGHVNGQIKVHLGIAGNLAPYNKWKEGVEITGKALSLSRSENGESDTLTAICYCKQGYFQGKMKGVLEGAKYWEKGIEILKNVYGNEEHVELANCFYNKAEIYFDNNFSKEALDYYTKANSIYENRNETIHKKLINTQLNIGILKSRTGANEEVLEYYYKNALKLSKQVYGENHSRTAICLGLLGTYYRYSNPILSDSLMNKALSICLNQHGRYHPSVVLINRLASSYKDSTIYFYQETIEILKKIEGENSSHLAEIYNSFSLYYLSKPDFQKAYEYLNKALDINIKYYGNIHKSVADNYYNFSVWNNSLFRYKEAISDARKALNIRLELFDTNHMDIAESHRILGSLYHFQDDYEKTLSHLKKSEKIFKDLNMEYTFEIGALYVNLGHYYTLNQHYEKAELYYSKTLSIYRKIYGNSSDYTASALKNLASLYDYKKDFVKAEKYYLESLNIYLELYGDISFEVAQIYRSLGDHYLKQKSWTKAHENYNQTLSILEKKLKTKHPIIAEIHNSLAAIFTGEKEYEQAIEQYKEALTIYKHFYDTTHVDIAVCYLKLGKSYSQISDFKESLYYSKKALEILLKFKNIEGIPRFYITYAHFNRGEIFLKRKDYDNAAKQYQKAIESVAITKSSKTDSEHILNYGALIFALRGKAETLETKYDETQDVKDLKDALSLYNKAIQEADKATNNDAEEETKLRGRENQNTLYQKAAEVHFKAFRELKDNRYLKEAFHIAEKSKAAILRSQFNDLNAKRFHNIPERLIEKERIIKRRIASLKKSLAESRENSDTLMKQIIELNSEYERLLDTLRNIYSDYFERKYNTQVTSISELQNIALTQKDMLLNFMLTDTSIFIFAITKNDFRVHQFPKPDSLGQIISDFRRSISDDKFVKNHGKKSKQLFRSSAHRLYQILLSVPLKDISSDIKNLIIIPDDILHHVNFGLLLENEPTSEKVQPKKFDYVLKKYAVSYNFSATILRRYYENDTLKVMSDFDFGGFAADYTDSPHPQLKDGQREVEIVGQLFEGKSEIWRETAATEANLKSNARKYRILHFSAHGILDDQNPTWSHLALTDNSNDSEDDSLHVAEIYNLDLNAEFAVLSACQSGFYSDIKKGEGMISLARAFAYAGCPAVLMSQWAADDKQTSNLMIEFYKGLVKEGMAKDEALQQAQIQYLNQVAEKRLEHPFYWGGFVLNGDPRQISFD